jgi:hypothetical protein
MRFLLPRLVTCTDCAFVHPFFAVLDNTQCILWWKVNLDRTRRTTFGGLGHVNSVGSNVFVCWRKMYCLPFVVSAVMLEQGKSHPEYNPVSIHDPDRPIIGSCQNPINTWWDVGQTLRRAWRVAWVCQKVGTGLNKWRCMPHCAVVQRLVAIW